VRFRRGERDFPGRQPSQPHADEVYAWRRRVAAAKRAANGGNVVRSQSAARALDTKEEAEQREVNNIQRETGLDRQRATWLHGWRKGAVWLPNEAQFFCEKFEERTATAMAERASFATRWQPAI
jgi:hypothetical protein